jgi:zinc protease
MPLNSPTTYQLSNGLTIIAEQIPIKAVNFGIWLNIGSRIETDNINGMAHFLEHMIFKGTPRLPLGEFERRVENKGAITNAATSQDYTNYYITTAPRDFAELGPLQIDVLLNPTLQASDFQQERSVILEEIYRSADNVQRRIYQNSTEMAFKRLPYRRPVLGTSEVIEQLTEQQMRYFHATNYQPRAMTAVAVGNLPTQELIDIVADGFAAYCHQDSAPDFAGTNHCPLPEEPFRTVQRQEIVDPDLQQTRLVLMWRVPGTQQLADTYALDVVAALLSQGRTSRLVADLREDKQLVTGISASNTSYALQGIFSISVQLPTANLAEVEEQILAHIVNLSLQPVAGAEIDRLRRQVANRHIFGNETPSARGSMYGYYQAVTGDFQAGIDYPAKIQAVEAADIQAAVCKYLNPQAYAALTMLPGDPQK